MLYYSRLSHIYLKPSYQFHFKRISLVLIRLCMNGERQFLKMKKKEKVLICSFINENGQYRKNEEETNSHKKRGKMGVAPFLVQFTVVLPFFPFVLSACHQIQIAL